MKYYLAYGSNLDKQAMKYRCPRAVAVGTAFVQNYELVFRGNSYCGYLTIEPSKGSKVPVGVWQIEDTDERALDIYEGYPSLYYKKEIELEYISNTGETQKPVIAVIYIMNAGYSLGRPVSHYITTCKRGYKDFGLDTSYLEKAIKEKSLR